MQAGGIRSRQLCLFMMTAIRCFTVGLTVCFLSAVFVWKMDFVRLPLSPVAEGGERSPLHGANVEREDFVTALPRIAAPTAHAEDKSTIVGSLAPESIRADIRSNHASDLGGYQARRVSSGSSKTNLPSHRPLTPGAPGASAHSTSSSDVSGEPTHLQAHADALSQLDVAVQVPPGEDVPLVLVPVAEADGFTPQDLSVINAEADRFVVEASQAGAETEPSHSQWKQARQASDELFRTWYGQDAYMGMEAKRYFDAQNNPLK